MFCNNCGNKLSENDRFCMACGQKVQAAPHVKYVADDGQAYCLLCGYPIEDGEAECANCGCPTEVSEYARMGETGVPRPKLTLHIWSIVCSLFISVIVGAVLAIIATVQAIKSGNKTLKGWSIAAIIICVISCILNIIITPIIYNYLTTFFAKIIG
ncbi:MAG: zinc ribbon domain-containing protein [Clostridiales bacterium]|nr:zinc ribbon domain-containing protein [Clostridiales bacterium]